MSSDQDGPQGQGLPTPNPFSASVPQQPADPNIAVLQNQITQLTYQVEALTSGMQYLLRSANSPKMSKTDVINYINQWQPASPIQVP